MRKKNELKTYKVTTVTVPLGIFDRMRQVADSYGMSQSMFIRFAIILAIQMFENEETDFFALQTIKTANRTDQKKRFFDDEL